MPASSAWRLAPRARPEIEIFLASRSLRGQCHRLLPGGVTCGASMVKSLLLSCLLLLLAYGPCRLPSASGRARGRPESVVAAGHPRGERRYPSQPAIWIVDASHDTDQPDLVFAYIRRRSSSPTLTLPANAGWDFRRNSSPRHGSAHRTGREREAAAIWTRRRGNGVRLLAYLFRWCTCRAGGVPGQLSRSASTIRCRRRVPRLRQLQALVAEHRGGQRTSADHASPVVAVSF